MSESDKLSNNKEELLNQIVRIPGRVIFVDTSSIDLEGNVNLWGNVLLTTPEGKDYCVGFIRKNDEKSSDPRNILDQSSWEYEHVNIYQDDTNQGRCNGDALETTREELDVDLTKLGLKVDDLLDFVLKKEKESGRAFE